MMTNDVEIQCRIYSYYEELEGNFSIKEGTKGSSVYCK